MPTPAPTSTVQILHADPDLAHGLGPERLAEAQEACVARSLLVRRGTWPSVERPAAAGLGFLILDGVLMRTVGVDSRYGSELLGQGDVIRPWAEEDAAPTLASSSVWRVLAPVRLAQLDRSFLECVAPWPEVTGNLFGRALMRARNLAINMAIVHHPRINARLLMLLWHLAGRWGKVGPGGISLSLPLTHAVLAELIASRRPTVTTALGELARSGDVQPLQGGWLLLGAAPREIFEDAALGGSVSRLRGWS